MIACGCASPGCAVNGCRIAKQIAKQYEHSRNQCIVSTAPIAQPCNCIGPQHGAPRCPCMMRNIEKRDGRWVQREVDLGPAT